MANPFGEKNIGPWEGQQVEYIPLDDLVLWTENPRDPLDGDYTNDDVIRRATDGRNEKQWQLSKLSKEMGDRFDLSELPLLLAVPGIRRVRRDAQLDDSVPFPFPVRPAQQAPGAECVPTRRPSVAPGCRGLRVLKGSAAGPASPSAPPISADCRVDGMPRPAGSPAVA